MRCQLARRPGLLCSFCPSPRTFALRLPPDKASRPGPCLRLVVILAARGKSGTPTGDFHPITSRPCWAHTHRCTRPATGGFAAFRRRVNSNVGPLRCRVITPRGAALHTHAMHHSCGFASLRRSLGSTPQLRGYIAPSLPPWWGAFAGHAGQAGELPPSPKTPLPRPRRWGHTGTRSHLPCQVRPQWLPPSVPC